MSLYLWPCGLRRSPLLRHHVTERTDFASSKHCRSAPGGIAAAVLGTEARRDRAGTFPRKRAAQKSQSRIGAVDGRFPIGRSASLGTAVPVRQRPRSIAGEDAASATPGQNRPALTGQARGTRSTRMGQGGGQRARVRPCTTRRWNGPGGCVTSALRARSESLRALRSAGHHGPGRSTSRYTARARSRRIDGMYIQ